MAVNLNVVAITGNLTADPELRSLASGTSVCSLRVACNTRRKNPATGEWEDKPNFFNVTAWGTAGENCAKYLAKGRPVAINGRLEWREWEHEGQKRQSVEITAEGVQFLSDGKDHSGESSGGTATAQAASAPSDEIPFAWREVAYEDRYEHGSRW